MITPKSTDAMKESETNINGMISENSSNICSNTIKNKKPIVTYQKVIFYSHS